MRKKNPRRRPPKRQSDEVSEEHVIDLPNRDALSVPGAAVHFMGPPTIWPGPDGVDPPQPIQPEPSSN